MYSQMQDALDEALQTFSAGELSGRFRELPDHERESEKHGQVIEYLKGALKGKPGTDAAFIELSDLEGDLQLIAEGHGFSEGFKAGIKAGIELAKWLEGKA